MAAVSLENWKEQIRDPKIECMSRDEMTALQSERLINLEFSFIEASPYGGVSAGSTGVWSGDDSENFIGTITVQVHFIIDVAGVGPFFFSNIIIVSNGLLQFRAGLVSSSAVSPYS